MRFHSRSALAVAALGFGAALALQPGVATAQTFDVKIGFATINDPQHEIGKRLADRLNERSKGRLNARVFPAGQLGSIGRMIEGIQLGTQEILIVPPGFFVGINQALQVPDAPGVFDDVMHAHRSLTDPTFRAAYAKLLDGSGISMLALYVYGPTSFASIDPIRKLDDLKGKKVRVLATKMESKLMAQYGATGVPIDYVEVLPALQRRTIDAVRSSIIVMGGSKFFTVTKFITVVESGQIPSAIFGSEAALKRMPEDLRKLVVDTARGMELESTQVALEFGAKAEQLWKDNGAEVIRLPAADQAEFMRRARPLGDEFLGTNPKTKPMWEMLKASIERNRKKM